MLFDAVGKLLISAVFRCLSEPDFQTAWGGGLFVVGFGKPVLRGGVGIEYLPHQRGQRVHAQAARQREALQQGFVPSVQSHRIRTPVDGHEAFGRELCGIAGGLFRAKTGRRGAKFR